MKKSIFLLASLCIPCVGHACMIVPTFAQSVVRPLVILAIGVAFAMYAMFSIGRRYGRAWWKLLTPIYLVLIAAPLYRATLNYNPSGAVNCNMQFGVELLSATAISLLLWLLVFLFHRFILFRNAKRQEI